MTISFSKAAEAAEDLKPMMTVWALVSVAAITLFAQQAAFADEVPTFEVDKSCKVDVQAYQGQGTQQSCLADEQKARTALLNQWTQFAPESRARCTQMIGDGAGSRSYVELLTCLQMAKDAKGLPKN